MLSKYVLSALFDLSGKACGLFQRVIVGYVHPAPGGAVQILLQLEQNEGFRLLILSLMCNC